MATDVGRSIQRDVRRLTVITVVLIGLVVGLGVVGYAAITAKGDQIRQDTARTTGALCTLRADLARRVQSSVDFLVKHPEGIPGIPPATLRSSIVNQQQTIKALASLKCRS